MLDRLDPLFHMMIDSVPDCLFVKDRQGRFLINNIAHVRLLGAADARELAGQTDFDRFPGPKAQEYYTSDQVVMESGQPSDCEEIFENPRTGETHRLRLIKTPLRDQEGRIVGLLGIMQNITDRKQADEVRQQASEELQQRIADRTAELSQKNAELSHERLILRTLIDNLPDGIYAKDAAGRKTLVNPADLKVLRCKKESEAIGKTDFDLFPAEIAAKFFADDQAVVQTGQPVINREEYFFDEEGQKRWLLTSKLPLRDSSGTIVGLVGVGRDITSLKAAERELEAVHRELQTASRRAGMAEVATGVLHNVGNVLNSVNVSAAVMVERLRGSKAAGVSKLAKLLKEHSAGMGRFLTEDERGRQVPAYLEQLGEHLEREHAELRSELRNLTHNIEHIKEIVATQQNYARVSGVTETVMAPELVDDALKIHGSAYMRHGVTVAREYNSLLAVSVDKHKVLQILVNLLSNAKYACDAGGKDDKRVTVRIKKGDEGRVLIEVADNGAGIAAENLTRIFSLGFTTRKGGHGFGLHSGALAARELGGSLSVHSDGPGQGATFTLEFPVTPAAHDQEKA